MPLFEDRTNAIISPTNHQKAVLCKIKAAATPQVAASEISRDQHLLAARDMLQRLGMISIADNQAMVTDAGEELMRNQNLIDESGELTDEGRNYAHGGTQPPPQPQRESVLKAVHKLIK